MHVNRKDGSTMTVREYQSGLYYYDASHHTTDPKTKDNSADYLFLTTVAGNKARFTRRELEGADKAQELYRKIEQPSEKMFNDILDNNRIRNCPVTSDDAKWALRIYGPDIATLKSKTVKQQNRGIQNH
jgi:hypothetical protein